MRTAFADDLIRKYTSKHILDESWLCGILHLQFESVKQNLRKLIDIHLLSDVSRIPFVVFERIAEIFRIVELPIAIP